MNQRLQYLIIIALVAASTSFFGARFLPKSLINYSTFLAGLLAFVLSIRYTFVKRVGFVLPVQLIVLSIFIGLFSAYISWGQGFSDNIKASFPYMIWVFFFYMLHRKIPVDYLERIIVGFGIAYVLIYVYQYSHSATPLFGGVEEFGEDRGGVKRIDFAGSSLLTLMGLISITKFTTEKKYKLFWITLALICFLITVLQVSRQSIAALLFVYFFHFMKDLKTYKKIIFLVAIVFALFYFQNSKNPIIESLLDAQRRDMQEGQDYIRLVAANFFLTDFSPDNFSRIFGNGVPYALNSQYAIYMFELSQYSGFYLSDIGLVGLYTMFGILPILAYLMIWWKSIKFRVPPQYYYVKYFLWVLLITSLSSNSIFSLDAIFAIISTLYIYQVVRVNKHAPYQVQSIPLVQKKEPAFSN